MMWRWHVSYSTHAYIVTKKLDSIISFWMELNMQVEVQENGLLKFQSLRSCVDKRDTTLVMINLLQL
ncbi:hypothetical protein HanPI659440_Chr08g0295891 [Helianthus annuus]|nr:hypothetical protein HanPI659440_Chr08g0295891 [Helianthus annuus]